MFCSKCGAESPDGARFCSKCGAELAGGTKPSEVAPKPEGESSTGMSPNVAGLLCYVATWVTGIVFVALEKKSKFVKFHAWQSIMTFGALTVVLIISSILHGIAVATLSLGLWHFANALSIIVGILMTALWIALMLLAYQGKMWKVPLAGNWAEKQANK